MPITVFSNAVHEGLWCLRCQKTDRLIAILCKNTIWKATKNGGKQVAWGARVRCQFSLLGCLSSMYGSGLHSLDGWLQRVLLDGSAWGCFCALRDFSYSTNYCWFRVFCIGDCSLVSCLLNYQEWFQSLLYWSFIYWFFLWLSFSYWRRHGFKHQRHGWCYVG